MEIPRPLKFPRDIQGLGAGWVVQNLEKYGNSALPDSLFETMSVRTIERLLSVITDEKIVVFPTKFGYIAERKQCKK